MILAVAFSVLNVLRGRKLLAIRGRGNDWNFAVLCGLCAGLVSQSIPIGIIVFAGMRLGEMSGHSFDEITGEYNPGKYHAWIETVGIWVLPRDGYQHTNKLRGMLMRTLRSAYYYPMFIALAFVAGPQALFAGLGVLTFGLLYGLVGMFGEREYSVAGAEVLAGGVMGVLITLATGGG